MSQKPWFAIVNPASANGKTRKVWPKIYKKLVEHGIEVDYAYTNGPEEATAITREALKTYTQIISVGGDGTLNEVVNGFFDNQKPLNPEASLAYLFQGTGGDFPRIFNQKRDLPSFIEILQRKKIIPVDCGLVQYQDSNGEMHHRYFLNVGDVGLGSQSVYEINHRSKALGGRLSFLLGGIKTILSYKNIDMKCVIDGKVVANGLTNSIWVANGRFVGGGMMIAPHAELDDGLFDVIVIGDLSTITLLRNLPKIYKGQHLNVPDVTVHRGKEVSIISNQPAYLDLDGETPGFTPVHFKLIPKSIRLWI
jgi:YegS/Rv2252/BmrU family lipid kinase